MTLTDFLLARIAEDEEMAKDAVPTGWVTFRNPDGSMKHTALGTPEDDGWLVDGRLVQDERAEIFYDPARVLADVEAKRALIAELVRMEDEEIGWDGVEDKVLTYLARSYADHPDFDPAWRI